MFFQGFFVSPGVYSTVSPFDCYYQLTDLSHFNPNHETNFTQSHVNNLASKSNHLLITVISARSGLTEIFTYLIIILLTDPLEVD